MTDSSHSPLSTPKRKRSDLMTDDSPSPLFASFSFDLNGPTAVPASGSSSPRTRVAHRFRGLALTDHGPASGPASGPAADAHGSGLGGGGVASAAVPVPIPGHLQAPPDNDTNTAKHGPPLDRSIRVDENEAIMRKRTRLSPHTDTTAAPLQPPEETGQKPSLATDLTSKAPPQLGSIPTNEPSRSGATGQLMFDTAIFSSSPRPSPAKLFTQVLSAPSNRSVETFKSKVRKRVGTPTLVDANKNNNGAITTTTTQASKTEQTAGTEADFIDPIRAALTWHEDEITVYDPEDEDDDGVGINGIGFKPTPAIAYARTMKRRQQLAEYKKREEREARARRNRRRRGSPERPIPTREREESAARKVRFTEAEPSMMIETI